MSTYVDPDVKHPAKFSPPILVEIARVLDEEGFEGDILDPFAGVGRIHALHGGGTRTWGIEIEPEWAALHPRTEVGNALDMEWDDEQFDAIITSPVYGNRMSDHHDAKDGSRRITYRHTLGRALHEDNAGRLNWGKKYQDFHRRAWDECLRVLKSGGLFVLNISDHVRAGEVVRVSAWHKAVLAKKGVRWERTIKVPTQRMRMGENAKARVEHELVYVGRKAAA